MKLRKSVKRLVESSPVDFMTLMKKAVRRARLNESMEDEDMDVDTEEGLDELGNSAEGDDELDDVDFDDEDLEGADDRETVTITIPVDATLEEISDAIEAARSGGEDAALDAEADAAAEEAADDVEADAAADEALDDMDAEDAFDAEEDEEAFASTRAAGPVRKPASTSYTNKMTVDSNIRANTGMGKPATIADGSPKRRPASNQYDNQMTIKSRIQKDTRWYQ